MNPMMYIRMAIVALAIAALLGENFWVYRKGQNSIISNVVAGVATTAKQEEKRAAEAIIVADSEASKQETIKVVTKVIHDKLQASVTANPRAECVLSPDELLQLQQAAARTAIP